jgi:hypothetical protein
MTTPNEPLHTIQVRIDELQATIAEKEEQIKQRATKLKDDLKNELSPAQLVKHHPFVAVGTTFVGGFFIGRTLSGYKHHHHTATPTTPAIGNSFLATIGAEVVRSLKDVGIAYLHRYFDKKKNL